MLASIIHLILVTISVSFSCSAATQVAKVNRERENQFVAEVETDCELGKVEHMHKRLPAMINWAEFARVFTNMVKNWVSS